MCVKLHLVNNIATASLVCELWTGVGFRLMSILEVRPLPWKITCQTYLKFGEDFFVSHLWQYSGVQILPQVCEPG